MRSTRRTSASWRATCVGNPDGSARILPAEAPTSRFGECANCHQPEYSARARPAPTSTPSPRPTSTPSRAPSAPHHRRGRVGGRHPAAEPGRRRHGLRQTTMRALVARGRLVFGPYEDATFARRTDMRAAQRRSCSRRASAPRATRTMPIRATRTTTSATNVRRPPSQTTYMRVGRERLRRKGVPVPGLPHAPVDLDAFCNRVNFTRDKSQVRSQRVPGTTPRCCGARSRCTRTRRSRTGALAVRVE